MHIRIVRFCLDGVSADEYLEHARHAAPAFTTWPGLRAKWWLVGPEPDQRGGLYLFDDAANADASREEDAFRRMVANPAFADLTIEEHATIAELDALTVEGVR